jgi:hypothetical protein
LDAAMVLMVRHRNAQWVALAVAALWALAAWGMR